MKGRKKKVSRIIGMVCAAMLIVSAIPTSAIAAESPIVGEMSGELPELMERVNYPFVGEDLEGFEPLNVNLNYVTDNSTFEFSKKPSYKGKIDWYGYIYFLDENNNIIEYTGQIAYGTNLTEIPTVIDISSKEFGAGYAGNFKNAIYQITFDCTSDTGEYTDISVCYRIFGGGKDIKEEKRASNTQLTVNVNNEKVLFEAFNIDNNNYISLRDFAMAVNGTEKQFDVGYDSDKNAITLTSKKAYTATGNELPIDKEYKRQEEESRKSYEQFGIRSDMGTSLIDSITANAVETTSKIFLDGQEISLTAYNINGSNYFQLRSIAKLFDIGVTYDNATSTVGIDTSVGYTE